MIKMFRRILCLAVAVLMILAALSACGEPDDNSTEATEAINLVTVVLAPDVDGRNDVDVTDEMLDAAETIIGTRLESKGVVGCEMDTDYDTDRITVRFPQKRDDEDYDPAVIMDEITETGYLSIRNPDGEVMMDGSDVKKATANLDLETNGYMVLIEFTYEGMEKFAEITKEYIGQQISVYMDDELLSAPTVQAQITDGCAQIIDDFTADEATRLADQINSGTLPFSLKVVESDI